MKNNFEVGLRIKQSRKESINSRVTLLFSIQMRAFLRVKGRDFINDMVETFKQVLSQANWDVWAATTNSHT